MAITTIIYEPIFSDSLSDLFDSIDSAPIKCDFTSPNKDTDVPSLERTRELFDSLDLEPIKFKLMNPHKKYTAWSLAKCDEVAEQYKMFLQLCKLYPTLGIVPSHDIDDFWHQHILDTQKYEADCLALFGYFLHHYPYFGLRGAEDAEALAISFENTRALFLEHFDFNICDDAEAESCRDDCVSLSVGHEISDCISACLGENCSVCTPSAESKNKSQVLERPRPAR